MGTALFREYSVRSAVTVPGMVLVFFLGVLAG
jgi:hypothetical protein